MDKTVIIAAVVAVVAILAVTLLLNPFGGEAPPEKVEEPVITDKSGNTLVIGDYVTTDSGNVYIIKNIEITTNQIIAISDDTGAEVDLNADTIVKTTAPQKEPEVEKEPVEKGPAFTVNEAEIEDIIKPDVEGNCTLFIDLKKDKYECFGTAGNFSTQPLSMEFREATHEKYFCKPTKYGCRLYEKVEIFLN